MPAFSATPPGKTALTCCNGAYNCPLIDLSTPPSLTCPRTLKPNPVSHLYLKMNRNRSIYDL